MSNTKIIVEVSEQVSSFVRQQSPETRRRLRLALRHLDREQGDIRMLEGPLSGFHRLRVGAYRIIFAYAESRRGTSVIQCIFAEQRSIVYLLMEELMRSKLKP